MRRFQPTVDSVEPTTENNLGRVNPPSSNLCCSRGPCTQDHGPLGSVAAQLSHRGVEADRAVQKEKHSCAAIQPHGA